MEKALIKLDMPKLNKVYEGKVREVYDLGEHFLIVATDRISAFDVIFSEGIPNKGIILTQISNHWFERIGVKNHLVATEVSDFPKECHEYKDQLEGRAVVVKKAKRVDFECIVRGYIIGSGWKDYQKTGEVCGIKLPEGLKLADRLEVPLFTPSTKAPDGEHDMNIDFETMKKTAGVELSEKVKALSIDVYKRVRDEMLPKGIILADTKFEVGLDADGEIMLIDECCTPDSSRFWDASTYKPGENPLSFDKQVFRDYLETTGWGKTAPAPAVPEDIIQKTYDRYAEILKLITGKEIS